MNFNKRQNEFCDIPGFDASKGERIVQAFNKLWKRIQHLEQNRTPGKKLVSETLFNSDDEDFTLTDIQYQLLIIQLQYVRTLLRQRLDSNNEVHHSETRNNEQDHNLPTSNKSNMRIDDLHADTVTNSASSGIQAASHSADSLSSAVKSDSLKDKSGNTQDTFANYKHSTEMSTTANQRAVPSSSKPHYHLKLDDVPFILGASSTASHSVVANVQNIIAMMKSHSKVLCGPKPTVTKPTVTKPPVTKPNVTNTHSTNITEKNIAGENSSDATKMLNDLSKELCDLAARQQKLVKYFDSTQIKKQDYDINSASNAPKQRNTTNYQIKNEGSKMHRSVSESDVKLHAEIKKVPKMKEKNFVRPSAHPKQSAYNVKSQPSNLSIMDRRKLLRSLQNFKKHLSEEDISWN